MTRSRSAGRIAATSGLALGAFVAFVVIATTSPLSRADEDKPSSTSGSTSSSASSSTTASTTASRGHPPSPGGRSERCDACHTPDGWHPAKFAHDRTGFALRGRHVDVRCASCHPRDWKESRPQTCAGCHDDVHLQEFGTMCRSCHDEKGWQPLFIVDAHRRTNFPLTGRHGTLPCTECHIDQRERTFTRVALDCVGCHAKDRARATTTTLDHQRLDTNCRACHEPAAFAPARFAAHEACFPLVGTVHAGVRCAECHSSVVGAVASGQCVGVPVACASCHEHRAEVTDPIHADVAGYAHESEKCAGCHRAAR